MAKVYSYAPVNWLLVATVASLLFACNSSAYNKSLVGQINDLKQEVQRLQEENRQLTMTLEEVQNRYGIHIEQIKPTPASRGSIFERVFSNPEAKPANQ